MRIMIQELLLLLFLVVFSKRIYIDKHKKIAAHH